MRKKGSFLTQTLLPILILGALLFAVKQYKSYKSGSDASAPAAQSEQPDMRSTGAKSNTSQQQDTAKRGKSAGNVPKYALDVLAYVKQNGEAPAGVVGGRQFQNREKRLIAKDATGAPIKYQEWDVHKKQNGKNRGAERLITGSDGSAYYTNDHYKTFQKVE